MSKSVPPELVELARTKVQDGIRTVMDTQVKLVSLGLLGDKSKDGLFAALSEMTTSYMMVDPVGAIQFVAQVGREYAPKFAEALLTAEATYGTFEAELHLRDQAEGN